YNGCGILVAAMKAGDRPDAYFACDKSFMDQVNDLFLDATDVSQNQLVILVHKGNPRGIHALKDLAQKDLKVGVGHEKQCALGTQPFAVGRESANKHLVGRLLEAIESGESREKFVENGFYWKAQGENATAETQRRRDAKSGLQ